MKAALIVLGMIILLGLVAAGSFWGGMAYQTSRVDRARANFAAARGQFPGGAPGLPQEGIPGIPQGDFTEGGFAGRGGTTGQVKEINGDVLTLSTAQDVSTVQLSDSTQIEKSVEGTRVDLQPGTRLLVTGERDTDGNIDASRITILSGNFPGPVGQPAPGMEP